jgi:putative RNA 2'-phosphotransferase
MAHFVPVSKSPDKMSKESRYLSLVLRHQPDKAGLRLDRFGWAGVDELIRGVAKKYPDFTFEKLLEVVSSNDKKRFEFDPTSTMIRACQGSLDRG